MAPASARSHGNHGESSRYVSATDSLLAIRTSSAETAAVVGWSRLPRRVALSSSREGARVAMERHMCHGQLRR